MNLVPEEFKPAAKVISEMEQLAGYVFEKMNKQSQIEQMYFWDKLTRLHNNGHPLDGMDVLAEMTQYDGEEIVDAP